MQKKRLTKPLFAVAVAALLAGAGCSSSQSDFVFNAGGGSQARTLNGVVQTGGTSASQGLPGAEVSLFQATGDGTPDLVGQAVADGSGRFSATVTGAAEDGVYFAKADMGNGLVFMTIVGERLPESVTINELTTVGAAYSACQLIDGDIIRSGDLPFRIAAGMSANLVNPVTGQSSQVMLNSPNADQTNSLRSTRNLANALAACVDSPANRAELLALTTTADGTPSNTLEALVSLARHPATEVQEIYQLSDRASAYEPSLERVPDAWTLCVKVNNTGNPEIPFGGAANTVFDDRGYAWIANNTVQGTTQSSNSVIVLKPDGTPADGTNGSPLSPVTAGGILGPGFGVTRDPSDGHIWIGNFGWGGLNPGPPPGGNGNGSVTELFPDGTPVSGPNGYDGGTDRVQGILVDPEGNVWTANVGSNSIVVFLDGDPNRSVEAPLSCHPFGLAFAPDGTVWATTAAEGLPTPEEPCDVATNVSHWRLDGDQLVRLSQTFVGNIGKGIDIDRDGFVWATSGADDTIYRLNPAGEVVGAYQGGGIKGPWCVRIDDAGDVWVANFGAQQGPPNNIYLDGALSVLAGPGSPSGLPVGTPISPATGYTLPSAGQEVLLSDGTPLSQTGFNQPKFTPLMRSVSAIPDRAGNVWVSNNWKPNFTTNQVESPGGDGMVIFVGVGHPTEPGRTQ